MQLFSAPWDHPQLTEAEINNHKKSAFEWWYFDFSTPDGIEGVIIYSRRNPVFASGKTSILFQLNSTQKNVLRIQNFSSPDVDCLCTDTQMLIKLDGENSLEMISDSDSVKWHLKFLVDGVKGELVVTPQNRGFLPGDGGRYVEDQKKNRFSAVSFSAPSTEVVGSLLIDSNNVEVNGVGYHDHPWGTVQLLSTHHQWNWVRARFKESAVMFARVNLQNGYSGGLNFLYLWSKSEFNPKIVQDLSIEEHEWKRAHFYGIKFPHQLTVTSSIVDYNLNTKNSLLDSPIYNRSSINLATVKQPVENGTGWVEYVYVSQYLTWLVIIGCKVGAFFLRKFPFFGN